MLELDFLVTFRFQSVIFHGFVPVIEGYTVTVCPRGERNEFFWLNCSPRYFYGMSSGFFLRPEQLKSNGVTKPDFRLFLFFFAKKNMKVV